MTRTAGIVGGGTMGVGIAYVFASHQWQTTVVEPDSARAQTMQATVARVAHDGLRRGRLSAAIAEGLADSIEVVQSTSELPLDLDVIIESVPESLQLKRQVLRDAESRRPGVLASNTSTLSIDLLADGLVRPAAFLGMHFFNPVWSLALVEVIRGAATTPGTVDAALDVVMAIGKQAAVINDHPGFATSRLDIVTALESMRMVEQQVAVAADIDRAIRLAYRHPVGPLQLSDIVGLDVRLDTARALEQALGARFAPPPLLVEKVARGELGKKAGRGFYTWHGDSIVDA